MREGHPAYLFLRPDQAALGGAGELSRPFINVDSPLSMPLLLRSLATALLSFGFRSLEPVVSLLTSPAKLESRIGAFHDDMPHVMPVNDLICNGLRFHLRHGLPVRSSARRLALMLPVFALGPSLWVDTGLGPAKGPFLVPSVVRSMVPSALVVWLAHGLDQVHDGVMRFIIVANIRWCKSGYLQSRLLLWSWPSSLPHRSVRVYRWRCSLSPARCTTSSSPPVDLRRC